jgi:hypothetical protein
MEILRARKFYSEDIWLFGYYHADLKTMKEHQIIFTEDNVNPESDLTHLQAFEYFPYYSRRAHQFQNENKSTIRNEQFKKTYFTFLFTSLFNEPTSPRARISFIYFLLLQDRIDEADALLAQLDEQSQNQHRLQFDYIQCFIDMYRGYPSFAKARKIVGCYLEYPVQSWQKAFKSIADTLKEYDSEETAVVEVKSEFKTTVVKDKSLKISIPPSTAVYVSIFDINLELYFSAFPFSDTNNFELNTVSNMSKVFEAG